MGLAHRRVALAFLGLIACACGVAGQSDLPWAFNAPRVDGYSIDLLDYNPLRGRPWRRATQSIFQPGSNIPLRSRRTDRLFSYSKTKIMRAPNPTESR